MRIGAVVVVIWLVIGLLAAGQRGYLGGSSSDCAKAGNTVIAGYSLAYDGGANTIGYLSSVQQADGKTVPGIAPAAKQQGDHVAKVIKARLTGKAEPAPFKYVHKGNLATIGKRAAVIDFGKIKLKGVIAWWIWGLAHIYFLIGTRSRLAVAWSWLWIYLSGQHSARLITQRDTLKDEAQPVGKTL